MRRVQVLRDVKRLAVGRERDAVGVVDALGDAGEACRRGRGRGRAASPALGEKSPDDEK